MSSSTLEDFLCEKGAVLNFDAVCAIACDIISAIERLQDLGILHNNITTRNILIGQCPRVGKPIFFTFDFWSLIGYYCLLYPSSMQLRLVYDAFACEILKYDLWHFLTSIPNVN